MPVPRYAVSYTSPPDSPLARFGASVLGYDCFHAAEVPRRAIAGIDRAILVLATVEPRRHGFQGVFVAPFRIGERNEDALTAALDGLSRTHRPFPIGPLAVASHDRLIVLRPAEPPAAMDDFATACRDAFDGLRAPGSNPPAAFPFHMTLAGPIPNGELTSFEALMREAFAAFAADPIEIDAVSLMKQNDSASRFHVLTRRRLTGRWGS